MRKTLAEFAAWRAARKAGLGIAGPAKSPSAPIDGRQLWTELHRRPAVCDFATEAAWLAGWLARVPCGSCQSSASAILQVLPPAFGTWASAADGRMQYARWGWTFHNTVSMKIPGKSELPWEDAARLWGWT